MKKDQNLTFEIEWRELLIKKLSSVMKKLNSTAEAEKEAKKKEEERK